MQLLLAALALGIILGAGLNLSTKAKQRISRLTGTGIVILLFAMGAKMGSDPSLIDKIGRLGFQAFVLAAGAVTGSILLAMPAGSLLEKRLRWRTSDIRPETQDRNSNKGRDSA